MRRFGVTADEMGATWESPLRSLVVSGRATIATLSATLFIGISPPTDAREHFKRPAPYSEAVVYLLAENPKVQRRPSADYVRSHAARIVRIGDEDPGIVTFWDYLRWDNSKNDPKIKQRAGPLTMVIDFYPGAQPRPPAKPRVETLYCTKRYIYSDEGDFLEMKPPTSSHLQAYLK